GEGGPARAIPLIRREPLLAISKLLLESLEPLCVRINIAGRPRADAHLGRAIDLLQRVDDVAVAEIVDRILHRADAVHGLAGELRNLAKEPDQAAAERLPVHLSKGGSQLPDGAGDLALVA